MDDPTPQRKVDDRPRMTASPIELGTKECEALAGTFDAFDF